MLNFIVEAIFWCFCIYGILSLIKDIIEESTYKKIQKNIKIILTVKNVESGIENYIRELKFGKNFFNNLVVIDLDSVDNTVEILNEIEKDCVNMKTLTRREGIDYINEMLNPVN